MIRTTPFTSFEHFGGTAPYFAMPNPQPPSVRSATVMAINGYPVVAPTPGMWTFRKAGVPTALSQMQTTAVVPQGPVTYGSAAVAGPAVYAAPARS